MYIKMVDGVKIFVDIDGASLRANGPSLDSFPTMILIHGGPGVNDHSGYKSTHDVLKNIAQLLYVDLRGNGRSDSGESSSWNLEQWAEDIHDICQQLGIEKPILLGSSFGGFVAMKFAIMYPDNLSGLVLSSTSAKKDFERQYKVFERLGGAKAVEAARGCFENPSPATFERYGEVCGPLLKKEQPDPDIASRTIRRMEVARHFVSGEMENLDFLAEVSRIKCPTLVLGGEDDASTPIEDQEDIVNALGAQVVVFKRYSNCGHVPQNDVARKEAFSDIQAFVSEHCCVGA